MTEWLSALAWGDVPTWLSSLGGIGALIAATIAARASLNVLKIESGRDTDAADKEERAQADLVAAWLDRKRDDGPSPGFRGWHIVVANASKVPVHGAVVAAYIDPIFIDPKRAPLKIHDEIQDLNFGPQVITVDLIVLPQGDRKLELVPEHRKDVTPTFDVEKTRRGENILAREARVWITFRDASGVQWTRSDRGVLTRGFAGPFTPDNPGRADVSLDWLMEDTGHW